MDWTRSALPDLTGCRAVVTGANSGLGYATTAALAEAGAHVVMVCRDQARGDAAKERLNDDAPAATLSVVSIDLAVRDSIIEGADRLKQDGESIDILVNNAGVMGIPYREAMGGIEYQFAVNHLGHFCLTGLLLESLSLDARVVSVSSGMHRRGSPEWPVPGRKEDYHRWRAYANSKLANILFAYELDRRFEKASIDAMSVAAHPGYADTPLQQKSAAGSRIRSIVMRVANTLFAQSSEKGALPILFAATDPTVEGREFYGPGGLFNMRGSPEKQSPISIAEDEDIALHLWEQSEMWTGITYAVEDLKAIVEPPAMTTQ